MSNQKKRYIKQNVRVEVANEIVPTLLFIPIKESEDQPTINLLENEIWNSGRIDDIEDDKVLSELEANQIAVRAHGDNMVVYCDDGAMINIIEFPITRQVKKFFKTYIHGDFVFEHKEEESSEKEFFLMRPDTANLLDNFHRSVS